MPPAGEAFIYDQIPRHLQALLPRAFENAYAAVDALSRDEPMLGTPAARLALGHLRVWATDLAVQRLTTSGQWPFECDWVPYKNSTGKWLRVRLEASTLSVSQVSSPQKIPRQATYRSNGALNNEPFLDLDQSFRNEAKVSGLPHLLLVHGYHVLNFLHVGLPSPNPSVFGYIYQTPNLLRMPHVAGDDLPPPEAPDANPEVELLKEELRKWKRDSEQE